MIILTRSGWGASLLICYANYLLQRLMVLTDGSAMKPRFVALVNSNNLQRDFSLSGFPPARGGSSGERVKGRDRGQKRMQPFSPKSAKMPRRFVRPSSSFTRLPRLMSCSWHPAPLHPT